IPATLIVRPAQRLLTRTSVKPHPATVPPSGALHFSAKGHVEFGNGISELAFAWESSATDIRTLDQNGMSSGLVPAQSTINTTTKGVIGLAVLDVTHPTLVVNEVLAGPSAGKDGDANLGGARDGSQDEFIGLVNSTSAAMNISGW